MMVNEAILSGCAIVSFNVGVSQDIVNNYNGYLAKNFNSLDLAYGLQKCLFDSNLDSLQSYSRNLGVSLLSEEVNALKWEKTIQNL